MYSEQLRKTSNFEEYSKSCMKVLMIAGLSAASFTAAYAANPATSVVNTTKLAVTDTHVNVGILHSLSGTMAISETGPAQAERLAIEQINKQGGVLGRQIKIIQEDGSSDWPIFAEKTKKLLEKDHVAAIFGGYTSASRKAMLPILEQRNGLLYYPTFYEGLEQSKNVIYTGQEATQQVIEALNWLAKEKKAKTFYLVGSDYIWPRTTMKIARTHIEKVLKGKVVGEEYYSLGSTQFGSLSNKIKLKKPDAIIAGIVGGSNVSFYKQLKASGLDSKRQLLLTFSVTEDEVLGIGGENIAGHYSSFKYFQSLNNPNNAAFVKVFKAKYGQKSVVGDVTQAAYLGPWLWKAAVEKAKSFDVAKVTAASKGLELKNAPEGYVKVHNNQHLWSYSKIGQVQPNGQFKVVYTSPKLIEPNPFPKGY